MTGQITMFQAVFGGNADFVARTAGTDGNNLLVSTCPNATAYEENALTTLNNSSTAVGDTVL